MAKRKQQSSNKFRAREPDRWYAVEGMKVEKGLSSKDDQMFTVSLDLEEAAEQDWAVKDWFIPDHPKQFMKKKWQEFARQMMDDGNYHEDLPAGVPTEIPMGDFKAIVPTMEHWPQPSRVGVIDDSYTGDDGEDVPTLKIVEYDFTDNGWVPDAVDLPPTQPAEVPAASTAPTPDEQEAFWQFCKSAPEQLKDQVRTICANNRITPATLKAGDITVSKLNDVGETIAELIEKERQAEADQQLPDTEEGLPF